MAVGVEMDFKGGTLEQYDQVIGKMGLVHGGPMPNGGITHWVSATDDGIRVIDVWQSREQFEKFAQEQIGPFSQEAGLAAPEITFREAHNYLLTTPSQVPA
jgi:hypothetical protein